MADLAGRGDERDPGESDMRRPHVSIRGVYPPAFGAYLAELDRRRVVVVGPLRVLAREAIKKGSQSED